MNFLDYAVLFGTILGIAIYGTWRTRQHRDLTTYIHGDRDTRWFVIGISVMATQASATTFISIPGKGYEGGLSFVQNYFGAPFALILICAVFLPIFRHLRVDTAYEYLGRRFDSKTRLLGAALFLIQRGIGAGITIYAPAIVLTAVMGWSLSLTIVAVSAIVIIYTVTGGNDAVNVTQKYQFLVIFVGMFAAMGLMIARLPNGLGLHDALTVAGGMGKLNGVDFSIDPQRRYTVWSGLLGGIFLQLSYFGADQSQVQRYLSGASLRESRMGLIFNALSKIPMQFLILLLGVLLFVFYQFERPPVVFNQVAWNQAVASDPDGRLLAIDKEFGEAHASEREQIQAWLDARKSGDAGAVATAQANAVAVQVKIASIRDSAIKAMAKANPGAKKLLDSDYIFITFILSHLPHGLIGLLIAAFFAAALSSKAGELTALASTTTVDFYRHLIPGEPSDARCVAAARWFTIMWGFVAMGFALFAGMSESLVEAGNIVASIFYEVPLSLFLVAFFCKWVKGSAVFWAGLTAQAVVVGLYLFQDKIAYLWFNLIGVAACIVLSILYQFVIDLYNPD